MLTASLLLFLPPPRAILRSSAGWIDHSPFTKSTTHPTLPLSDRPSTAISVVVVNPPFYSTNLLRTLRYRTTDPHSLYSVSASTQMPLLYFHKESNAPRLIRIFINSVITALSSLYSLGGCCVLFGYIVLISWAHAHYLYS